MTEGGIVLVGTKRLFDLFTNGGSKSQDLEQLWSRVGIHDLLPGPRASGVQQIVKASLDKLNDVALEELQRTTEVLARRLAKPALRPRRLKEVNPETSTEKLVSVAAGQIIA